MVKVKGPTQFTVEGDFAYGFLGNNMVVKIDKDSLPLVEGHTWRVNPCGYAESRYKIKGRVKRVFMHRLIMGVDDLDWRKSIVDHKDMDKLNNTRENLRLCTSTENQINRALRKDNTSGCTGVYPEGNRWFVKICGNRLKGTFSTKEEAIEARKRIVNQKFTDFSPYNMVSNKIVVRD